MSTIDMTQVAGIQAVNAEGKVIGTLSVDDLTELVSAKIIQESKNEAVSARSASVMSEASTLAATDEYEDKLDIDTNPAYIRSLDTNGNPKRTAIASLASVVGGLLSSLGLYPIRRKGGITSDANTEINPGWVNVVGDSSLNIPSGAYKYGILVILGEPSTQYTNILQIYVPNNDSSGAYIYFRRQYYDNKPSDITAPWYRIPITKI